MVRGLHRLVAAAVAAGLAVSCAVLAAPPAFAGQVCVQEWRVSTFPVTSATTLGGPHYAAVSSPPAPPRAEAVDKMSARRLLRYAAFALPLIVLLSLAVLLGQRVRRRRRRAAGLGPLGKVKRSSRYSSLEAEASRGRHAVAGPAGSGFENRVTRQPDPLDFATSRPRRRNPPVDRSDRGSRRSWDPAEADPGTGRAEGPAIGHAQADGADAGSEDVARYTLPANLRAGWTEPGVDGIRKTSADPPWGPAEKPSGEMP